MVPEPELIPVSIRGRVLATWPVSHILLDVVSYTADVHEQDRRDDQRAYEDRLPPSREEFDILVARARALEDAKRNRKFGWFMPTQWVVFGFVAINYLSQWLFWSGYVQASGDR